MLFVYFFLAKNEEWRMKQEAPGDYEKYMTDRKSVEYGKSGESGDGKMLYQKET